MSKKLVILALMHGDEGGSYKHLIKYLNHLILTKNDNFVVLTNKKNLINSRYNCIYINIGDTIISPYLSIAIKLLVSFFSNIIFNKIVIIDFFNPIYLPSIARQIAIIRDLGELKFNKYDPIRMFYRTKIMLPLSIKYSSKIIAISDSTKKDILKNFQIAANKVETIYHGSDKFDECNVRLIKRNYFIYLGRVDANGKNILNLIFAFEKYIEENGNYDLILAGQAWRNSQMIFDYIKSSDILIDRVLIHGFVDDSTKEELLLSAKALIFISKFEGFGHPILEAQAKGCNALCSDIDIMKDISGNIAKFVNPNSIEQIKEGFFYYENYEYNEILFSEFRQNLRRFDWDKNFVDYDRICFE